MHHDVIDSIVSGNLQLFILAPVLARNTPISDGKQVIAHMRKTMFSSRLLYSTT